MKKYKIENLCTVRSSKRIFANQYTNEGIPFYRGKEITLLSLGQKISDLDSQKSIYNEKLQSA